MKSYAVQEKGLKSDSLLKRRSQPGNYYGTFIQSEKIQPEMSRILRKADTLSGLTVNQPDDLYEREADRVAKQIMRMPEPGEEEEEKIRPKPMDGGQLQRQVEAPEEDEEDVIRKKDAGYGVNPGNPNLRANLHSLKGQGHQLSKKGKWLQRQTQTQIKKDRGFGVYGAGNERTFPSDWVVTVCHRDFDVPVVGSFIPARHTFLWFHPKSTPATADNIIEIHTVTYDNKKNGHPDPNPRMAGTVTTGTYEVDPNKVIAEYRKYKPEDYNLVILNCTTVAYRALLAAGANPATSDFPETNKGTGLPDEYGRGWKKSLLEYIYTRWPGSDDSLISRYIDQDGKIDLSKIPNNLDTYTTSILCEVLLRGVCVGDDEHAVYSILARQSEQVFKEVVDKLTLKFIDSGLDGEEWRMFALLCMNKGYVDPILKYLHSDGDESSAKYITHQLLKENRMNQLHLSQRILLIRTMIEGICTNDYEQAILKIFEEMSPSDFKTAVQTLTKDFIDKGLDGEEWDKFMFIAGQKGYEPK